LLKIKQSKFLKRLKGNGASNEVRNVNRKLKMLLFGLLQ
jgi:hypothetical protein